MENTFSKHELRVPAYIKENARYFSLQRFQDLNNCVPTTAQCQHHRGDVFFVAVLCVLLGVALNGPPSLLGYGDLDLRSKCDFTAKLERVSVVDQHKVRVVGI